MKFCQKATHGCLKREYYSFASSIKRKAKENRQIAIESCFLLGRVSPYSCVGTDYIFKSSLEKESHVKAEICLGMLPTLLSPIKQLQEKQGIINRLALPIALLDLLKCRSQYPKQRKYNIFSFFLRPAYFIYFFKKVAKYNFLFLCGHFYLVAQD